MMMFQSLGGGKNQGAKPLQKVHRIQPVGTTADSLRRRHPGGKSRRSLKLQVRAAASPSTLNSKVPMYFGVVHPLQRAEVDFGGRGAGELSLEITTHFIRWSPPPLPLFSGISTLLLHPSLPNLFPLFSLPLLLQFILLGLCFPSVSCAASASLPPPSLLSVVGWLVLVRMTSCVLSGKYSQ